MTQVGLTVAPGRNRGPDDVELRLSLSARGGDGLLYGTAGMVVMAKVGR